MRLQVKICGMTLTDNIRSAVKLHPDFLGLIFHEPSPRNALNLTPESIAVFRNSVNFAGVFVNRSREEVLETAQAYGLAAVQLHGDESPDYCSSLLGNGYEVWKAIGIDNTGDLAQLTDYIGTVDRFVFDRKSPSRGGTGKKFDWRLLDSYTLPVPFMLGGGIGPDDVSQIMTLQHPRLAGVDLNSRFETSPGVKDINSLSGFLSNLKSNIN